MFSRTPKIIIYTDGACDPNPGYGGWAAIICYTNKEDKTTSHTISGHACGTTNNRMEIMAVLAALKRLKFACHVIIYTDSNYVVKSVGNWHKGKPDSKKTGWMVKWQKCNWTRAGKIPETRELKNKDLWEEMYAEVTRQASITMRWVPGHSGHEFNELCDAMAVEERLKAANGILET